MLQTKPTRAFVCLQIAHDQIRMHDIDIDRVHKISYVRTKNVAELNRFEIGIERWIDG